jgi:K319-like protein/calcineurin-like phosphoesterase family protein
VSLRCYRTNLFIGALLLVWLCSQVAVAQDPRSSSSAGTAGTRSASRPVEPALAAPAVPATNWFSASLVRTIDTAALFPPSPDPSGLTYLPNRNTLLLSDSEVEETVNGITHFAGANLWEMSLSGSVVRTANISKIAPTVVPMTNEPTGAAWNPTNGHFFFTDDDKRKVWDLDPGVDGEVGTADDSRTSFDTLAAGSDDPAGITFDTGHNQLFVVDGANKEVYQYTASGILVGQFDVERYGVVGPEGIEFNPDNGTLFILSNHHNPIIIETTTQGILLRTINVSAAHAIAADGLAYAPASDGSGVWHFYLADRGVDNDTDPAENDGKVFEMTAPPPLTPGNLPPTVNAGPDQAITLPASAALAGTIADDGLPSSAQLATSWSQISGPRSITFTDPNAVDTVVNFSLAGMYVLQLTADDGELSASEEVTITVTEDPTVSSLDVRVAAGSDDAEENTGTSVWLTSTDLDMVVDSGGQQMNQAVGIRFTGVSIPQGATIVNAFVKFQVDEVNSEPTQLTIQGEAADTAATFVGLKRNISSRPRTTTAVTWSPAPWTKEGEAGLAQQTPDIALALQEIVNRPGWASNNALAIIITGNGVRVAEAFEGTPTEAPLLHVDYRMMPPPTDTPTDTPLPTSTPTSIPPSDPVLIGAGDIASCSSLGDEATANLLDGIAGTVFTTGDNAYPDGTAAQYTNCYNPTWGRHKARTRPAVGNHEYHTAGASAYFNYFGAAAGDPNRGYYSYDLGAWHIVVLNSNCDQVGGCGAGSLQEQWLRVDLAAHPAVCTLAYWHAPRFSSGIVHGSSRAMATIWQVLYDYGAEVVLTGHEHHYERFARQDANGGADPERGIREFVLGMGGKSHYAFGTPIANSEVRNSDTLGVLKLTLHATSYDWQFIPEAGKTFTDAGSESCIQPSLQMVAPANNIRMRGTYYFDALESRRQTYVGS